MVAAVLNEAENIRPVIAEIARVLAGMQPFEVIFVDDGSSDDTLAELRSCRALLPELRVLSHDVRCGKSGALHTGIQAARAHWIATIDGDGQDDPSEIPAMLALAEGANGAAPLVVGIRLDRHDKFSRRLATRLANGLRRRLLSDGCPDTGAPMKLFARDAFLRLPQFEGLHRFLPALLGSYGHPLLCKPVRHRARLHGSSKYTNWNRALVGLRDMIGVMWLQKRTIRPGRVTES